MTTQAEQERFVEPDNTEGVQTQAPPDPTPEPESIETEPDWKAVAEQQKVQLAKAENDLKSVQGRQRQRDDDKAWRESLTTEVGSLRKTNQALHTAIIRGTTDELPDALGAIDAETNQRLGAIQAQTSVSRQFGLLQDAVKDEQENPVFDLETAVELDAIRAQWNVAERAGDIDALTSLVHQASRLTVAKVAENGRKATEAAVKAAEDAKKKDFEESGILESPTGGSSAGAAAPTMEQLVERRASGVKLEISEIQQVNDHLRNLDNTPGSAARGG